MAKIKVGNSLASNELRDYYVQEVKANFKAMRDSSLDPELIKRAPKSMRSKLEKFRDQLQHFEQDILEKELREGESAGCTVDEANFAVNTVRRLHSDFIMLMQPNLDIRKKFVRDFFKLSRGSRFSLWTKTLFAGGLSTALGFGGGALLFILALNLAVPVALGVAAGVAVVAGIVAAVVTHRKARNPHEERGSEVRACLTSIIKDKELETYITVRSQFIEERRAVSDVAMHQTQPVAKEPRFSLRSSKSQASVAVTQGAEKPKTGLAGFIGGLFKRSGSEAEAVNGDGQPDPKVMAGIRAAERREAYERKVGGARRSVRPGGN